MINKKLDGLYVRKWEEFQFMPKAQEALVILNKIFKRIIIVTNQQGIGKGIMSEQELSFLHEKMIQVIVNLNIKIDRIYHCPHLASVNCLCRKPAPGMLEQAIRDFPDIRRERSYLIGDSDTDIQAGESVGLHTVKVSNEFTLYDWAQGLIAI